MTNPVILHDNRILSDYQDQQRQKIEELQQKVKNLQEEIRLLEEFNDRLYDL